jgi:hypothetical protein
MESVIQNEASVAADVNVPHVVTLYAPDGEQIQERLQPVSAIQTELFGALSMVKLVFSLPSKNARFIVKEFFSVSIQFGQA